MKSNRTKWLISLLLITLLSSMALAACGSPADTTTGSGSSAQVAPEYEWRLQHGQGPKSMEGDTLLPRLADRVSAMSNGRIKITLYTAGEIVEASEILDAVSQGTIELGYSYPGYYKGIIPELTSFDLPPGNYGSTIDSTILIQERGLGDLVTGPAEAMGVKMFYVAYQSMDQFWSKEPIQKLDDFKGFKLRAYGNFIPWFESLGSAPVYIPHPEVYTALATGVIDGSMTGLDKWRDLNLYELCPYVYRDPLKSNGMALMMMNKELFDSLPPDLQAIMEEAIRVFSLDSMILPWHDVVKLNKEVESKYGGTLLYMPQEIKDAYAEATRQLMANQIAEGGKVAQGTLLTKEYLNILGY